MKLSKVIVVAPIRFRIAPKFGNESPITNNKPIIIVLNTTLWSPNSNKKNFSLKSTFEISYIFYFLEFWWVLHKIEMEDWEL